jgi:exopolyphosphatase/guanosine-5'-triphosphate,3'-diphosphate pyrophosphatase
VTAQARCAGTLPPVRVSVLDLGSNSFRLLVADVEPSGAIRPILRERDLLHLGADVAVGGSISPAAAAAAVASVQYLTDLAMRTGTDRSIVVATSAIRDAANQADITERLALAAGAPVTVLSGLQEARLGFLGVAASLALPDGPHLVLDLGGGSLELTIGHELEVEWAASVNLGVSRLHAEMATSDPLSAGQVEAIRARVGKALEPHLAEIAARSPVTTVIVGGPHRSIAQLVGAIHLPWQPPTLNQLLIPTAEIQAIAAELIPLDQAQRRAVSGMKESRVDHMATAAVIIGKVLGLVDADEVTVSYWGLREGAILDEFGIHDLPLGRSLRPSETRRMADRFSRHHDHDAHVQGLAFGLFDALGEVHGLNGAARELLGYAATLHTIGMSISFKSFHRHGAYLVENSELRGFDPTEIAMLASLVRFQRRGVVNDGYPPFDGLGATDQQTIGRLLPLLTLADAADRGLDQSVQSITLTSSPGSVAAIFEGGHDIRAEWAEAATAAFASAYGVDLDIEVAAAI